MGRTPQNPDLLFLAPRLKALLLKYQSNKGFQVVGLGITLTGLPGTYGMSGDVQDLPQLCLSQSSGRSQGQHLLAKGVILFSIRRFRHRSLSSL